MFSHSGGDEKYSSLCSFSPHNSWLVGGQFGLLTMNLLRAAVQCLSVVLSLEAAVARDCDSETCNSAIFQKPAFPLSLRFSRREHEEGIDIVAGFFSQPATTYRRAHLRPVWRAPFVERSHSQSMIRPVRLEYGR